MTPPSPGTSDEPRLALPLLPLVAASMVAACVIAGVWLAVGSLLGRGALYLHVALVAGAITVITSALGNVVTLPWIAKPASTAGLAWIAGSMVRFVAAATFSFLLYSAPQTGWSEDLARAKAPFLFAVASGFLLGLLLEVAVIARYVHRAPGSR